MRKSIWLWITLPWLAGCSVFGVNTVEEAGYQVRQADGDFELRDYASMVTVETVVEGDWDRAGSAAFRKLFDYISGNNVSSSEIAMTAPVIADREPEAGERIAMTAPVLGEGDNNGWRYRFVLPSSFTLESAPKPLDPAVQLVESPSKRVAVVRFSGLLERADVTAQTERLRLWMNENNLTPVGTPRWAGYNPPWTLPFLRRNEVLIEVE